RSALGAPRGGGAGGAAAGAARSAPARTRALLARHGVLEALACLEGGVLAGGDVDLLGGARLDPGARLAVAHLEGAEAGEGDLVALGDVLGHRLEERVHRLLHGLLGQPRVLGDL